MRRLTVIAVSLLALSGLLAACTSSSPSGATSSSTTSTSAATPPSAGEPTAAPVDTTGWTTYVSDRYAFAIGHPPDWTVQPADHGWTMEADAKDFASTGHEAFMSPSDDIRVSAWSVPSNAPESIEAVEAWVEQYCQESANTSCADIRSRAVPLCNETRDCHPGMLVPFENEVQAFFTGGTYQQQIVVLTVWRPESHPSVADYGGSRALLQAFLSTMDVCPTRADQGPPGCDDAPLAGAKTGDPVVAPR